MNLKEIFSVLFSKDFFLLFILPIISYFLYFGIMSKFIKGNKKVNIKQVLPTNITIITMGILVTLILFGGIGVKKELICLMITTIIIAGFEVMFINRYSLYVNMWHCLCNSKIKFGDRIIDIEDNYCPFYNNVKNTMKSFKFTVIKIGLWVFSSSIYIVTIFVFAGTQVIH